MGAGQVGTGQGWIARHGKTQDTYDPGLQKLEIVENLLQRLSKYSFCTGKKLNFIIIFLGPTCLPFDEDKKNAAKRSRQHAGKKYWEYAQRRVCTIVFA